MKLKILRLIGWSLLLCCSLSSHAAAKINLQQAIELALAHDPRIDEKKAFVRKAEGLLQEAKLMDS